MFKAIDVQTPWLKPDGRDKGSDKILITYASQFGTTGEVAETIGDALSQAGRFVEIKPLGNVKGIDSYGAVIIGSAIQYDKWMPEATEFVRTHQNTLGKMPVAYFFTCMTLTRRNEKTERQALRYSAKLHAITPQVKPVAIGRFAGAVDYARMSLAFRLILGGVLTVMGVKEGDYRDWEAIRTWAKDIDLKLVPKQL